MGKARLEAFSDGVIAVAITIMVLELKVPHGTALDALAPLAPGFFAYVLSFIFIAIYWNNHHHLLYAVERVTGAVLWANMHLLFWISLMPFVTGWMSENQFAPVPVAFYGVVMLGAGFAYYLLVHCLLATHHEESLLARSIGSDFKGKISLVFYLAAIPLAFVWWWAACALYVAVAAIWLVPDRRIEKKGDKIAR